MEEAKLKVEIARDGLEAVERVKNKGKAYYDFILMDIQMPNMDGYEATGEILKMYPDLKAPIIALSANAFSEDREASIKAGMKAHVAKPIVIRDLFGCLSNLLQSE